MCITKYYFISNRVKERRDGYLMISTSKGFNHAKKIAKQRFQMYGYKGRVLYIHPFSTTIGKAVI